MEVNNEKNAILYIIIIMAFYLLTGCDNKIKIENYDKKIKCDFFESKDILFVTSLNTSDKQDLIYLNDKQVYIVNYDKLFKASEQNCELLGQLNNEIVGIKGITFFTNNKYTSDVIRNLENLKKSPETNYEWINIADKRLIGSEMIFSKFYSKEGILYSTDNNVIETSFEEGEKIMTVYYQGDYVKTNKHIYKLNKTKTNSKECEKYTDVKCKYSYSFNINNSFDKYYKDLLYITVLEDSDFLKKYDWFDAGVLNSGEIIISDSFKN